MKKGLKNYLYQTAYQLLIVLTPLLTAPCLARALGTEGIGIYSYTANFANYFLMFLLKPCDEIEITGYRWGRTKDGKRYPSQRTGELFVLTLCEIMDWNPDYRYKVLGKMVQANEKALIAFDLTSSECFPKVVNRDGKKVSSRQSVFAEQWSGKFGPTYSESRRSLAVKTFDNYTVITVNGKKTEVHPQAQPQQQGSMGDSL